MDNRASPTPPASTRSKNNPPQPSLTASHAHASSSSQLPSTTMAPGRSRASPADGKSANRSTSKLVDADSKPATRPASRDSLKQKMPKKMDEPPRPSKAEEQVKALRSDLDSLRNHLTCKICVRLLHQPYTISCGHTYCYTCLCTWFVNNRSHKTCPDCRSTVKEMPAPSYVVRDMTSVFIARAELLLEGESIEEHKELEKEAADAVQQDKNNEDARNGGLFKGCFKINTLRGWPMQPIRDQEDGVDRCPQCHWEIEDDECQHCGFVLNEDGELDFTGFSDMDDMSEQDTEALDGDMELDYEDYAAYAADMDLMGVIAAQHLPHQGSFMMRRFLEGGLTPAAAAAQAYGRRPRMMSHSEAGSIRSYTQSIVSGDIYGDEMDTVEEEDEDGLDEEDSEMNDFIYDGELEETNSTSASSSTPGPAPRSSNSQARNHARARRVVESDTSSTISSVIEEEDEEEDEEDAGPVRRGQRNHASQRSNRSQHPAGPSSSASTDTSNPGELEDDQQALLREEGWMLQRDDDEMGEDDEDDSDTGTTVGWEPLANSNNRNRMTGSLTPIADRPRASAPIRPPSRTGNLRNSNASRGLRRRSSVLSTTSTLPYEDGEADDDDSEPDGDLHLAMNSLRSRRSQAQMRNGVTFPLPSPRNPLGVHAQGSTPYEMDTDDNSDNSQPGTGRRPPRTRRREYDPRISLMFAAHQEALQQNQLADALIDVESRSITPVARPRTRNRNRPSPAQAFSPFLPPARLRTPQLDNPANIGPALRNPVSPPRRNIFQPHQSPAHSTTVNRVDRAPSITSSNDSSAIILTPDTASVASSQQSIDSTIQAQNAATIDVIERPQSRVNARPSSAASRRNSAGFSPVNPSFPHANMGLHTQGSALPPFPARGNPWAGFLAPRGIRSRNSRQVLRDQSSTSTLRPASSRVNLRDVGNPAQNVRPQASRTALRPQPSVRRLHNQASTRTLRASELSQPPQTYTQNTQASTQPVARVALTPDERELRARELIETRRRALGQPSNPPPRTNPFTSAYQRQSHPNGNTIIHQGTSAPQHVRSNSNESIQSVNSNGTVQGAPTSPALRQRRSRNVLHSASLGVHQPAPTSYAPPATTYSSNYYRTRQGSFGNTMGYESSLNANSRGVMTGPLI